MNARIYYEPKCKQISGFIHFEGDFGSNSNTCVFSAPEKDATAPADIPISNRNRPGEYSKDNSRPLSKPDNHSIEMDAKLQPLLNKSMNELRSERWEYAARSFEEAQSISSKIKLYEYSRAADTPVLEWASKKAKLVSCLYGISEDILELSKRFVLQSGGSQYSRECNELEYNSLVDEASAKLKSAKAAALVNLKRILSPSSNLKASMRDAYIVAGCIELVSSKKISSACDFQDNIPMYRNEIRIPPSLVQECPDSAKYQYLDTKYGRNPIEFKSTYMTGYANRRSTFVDTCGNPIEYLKGIP